MHRLAHLGLLAALSVAPLSACGSDTVLIADDDGGGASPDMTAGRDAAADMTAAEDGGACSGELRPPATALFGESQHVAGRHLVQLSDSQAFACGALDGTPACSCTVPCSCWSLQITLPANPAPGHYQLSALGAGYTEQHSLDGGGWSSTLHSVTAGTLDIRAVEADGISAVLCGVAAEDLGPLPLAGAFGAAPCP